MERLLTELGEKLQKTYRDSLISVILYGSAAAPEGRDARSDYNILCVLRQVTPDELHVAQPVFRWWREMKNPAPLLMSLEEVRTSADSFPIEFHDICERHEVLFGEDVVRDIVIDNVFYRAQVEHELRVKLLRLRQKAGGVLPEPDLLLRLLVDSVSSFCVLFRHALILAGDKPRFGKRDIVAAARQRFGISSGAFDTILDLREEKLKPKAIPNTVELLRSCLDEIRTVINAVDRMGELKRS